MIKTTLQEKKEDIKDALMTLHEMGNDAEDCIESLQNAFIYNKSHLLKDSNKKLGRFKKEGTRLTEITIEKARDNPDLEPYVSVPAHLLMIGNDIEKLIALTDKKISEGILFSDKAVGETLFLLQRLIEILRPTSDIIIARNTFLAMYVKESQIVLGKMASEYATLHEERLIKGICLPAASSLYISMLEAIKNIAWNSKEIAVKLAG